MYKQVQYIVTTFSLEWL